MQDARPEHAGLEVQGRRGDGQYESGKREPSRLATGRSMEKLSKGSTSSQAVEARYSENNVCEATLVRDQSRACHEAAREIQRTSASPVRLSLAASHERPGPLARTRL